MSTERISNQELIQELKEVIAAMEIKDVGHFRLRAYQNAVSAIETSTYSVYDLWEKGRLQEIPGVGSSLAQHIGDLFEKGTVPEFESLKKDLPDGMFALIGIQGIGPKKAYKLAEAFDLQERETALEKVSEAAKGGKIRDIPGFGEKSEKQILDSIADLKMTKNEKPRMLWFRAEAVAQRIYKHMRQLDEVLEIEALGSFRRKKETVGDLDIAAATKDESAVMAHFLEFPEIAEVLVQGDKKASVVLSNDLQVDFRATSPESYGSMVQYFTGSKYHNILVRTYALEKGFSVSEYGIKRGDTLHEFPTEKEFYEFLDLDHIPPELRQGKEEVDLAASKDLPNLIELSDIKGDLHTHTTFSDGLNTLEEMVAAAKERGYKYLGIADHNPSVSSRGFETVANIIDENLRKIAQMNAEAPDFRIFFGYEVDILADTSLGLPDDLLEKLDFVIAGIHTAHSQPREQITSRYVAALNHPLVDIIAHPSGRLLGERGQLELDWMTFLEEAAKNNKTLEINAQPQRLDMPYDMVKEAKNMGVKLIIDSDSHTVDSLDFVQYGVNVARRGWCEAKDILNTLPTDEFLRSLRQ